jgi:uncharacterized protein
MNIDYPYAIGGRGRTATTTPDAHVRDLIEQVLFTSPGERVNRPDFGCGLLQLVFTPNSPDVAAATQFLIQGALQQWLGDVISVEAVGVVAEDSSLRVTVQYIIRRTEERAIAEFTR